MGLQNNNQANHNKKNSCHDLSLLPEDVITASWVLN